MYYCKPQMFQEKQTELHLLCEHRQESHLGDQGMRDQMHLHIL